MDIKLTPAFSIYLQASLKKPGAIHRNGIAFRKKRIMKPILFFLLIIPSLLKSQSSKTISYQEGIDHCLELVAQHKKEEPDKFFMAQPNCLIGVQVPEFSATTLEGKKFSSNYFNGKITILNFWTVSCQPCIAEIPGFNALVDQYGNGMVQFLAIGNDSEADIKKFLQQNPWKFNQASNGMLIQMEIFQLRSGYPTTYVINREGTIISAFAGGKSDERAAQEIQDKLKPILDKELQQ
jgi:peroxiredoxin